jgi:two-component system, NarL family, sensor kinase
MIRKIIPIIILLLLILPALPGKADLFFIMDEKYNRELTAEDLFRKAQQHLYSDPAQAREFGTKALEKITDVQKLTLRLQVLNFIGISYNIQSTYDQALEYFHQAAAEALHGGQMQQMSNSYNNIAVVHSKLGNYKDALEYYMRSLDGYELDGRMEASAVVFTNMGKIYSQIDNRSRAIENFDRAIEIFYQLNDSIRLASVFSGKSSLYLKASQPDSAMYFAQKAYSYCYHEKDLYVLSSILDIKARIYLHNEDYDNAYNYFSQAFDAAQEIGFFSGMVSILNGKAELFMETRNFPKAIELANSSLQTAEKIMNNKLIYEAHELLSRIYVLINDRSKAYDHFITYYQLKSEQISQDRLHQVYNIELERAAQVSMREIAMREQLLMRKNTTIILISLAFALVLTILALVYYIHNNRQRQKQKRLKDEELLRLTEERARASLQAEISERRRLGLELHDGVSPLLSLARMNITALLEKKDISPDRKNELLGHTVDTLDQLLEEMKGIAQNMSSAVLFEKGFEEAIGDLVEKINHAKGCLASVDISGVNGNLETYVEHTLYRAVQEAVNNIINHAQASRIHIQVTGNHEDLTIMIEDNGKGFNEKEIQSRQGMGLKSITSRIQGLKGEFFIDSVIGRGTILTMIIPLN